MTIRGRWRRATDIAGGFALGIVLTYFTGYGTRVSPQHPPIAAFTHPPSSGMDAAGFEGPATAQRLATVLALSTSSTIDKTLDQLAEQDGHAALERAARAGLDFPRRAQLLQRWLRKNPAEAWQWLSTVSKDPALVKIALYPMAAYEPELMISAVLPGGTLHSTDIASEATEALLKAGNLTMARRLVGEWSKAASPDGIGSAVEQVSLAMAESTPREASQWLAGLTPSPEVDHAVASFAARWGGEQPDEAMQWAANLPGTFSKSEAMQNVFLKWADLDIYAATKWLAAQDGTGPVSDAFVLNLLSATNLSHIDPKAAMNWAELVEDSGTRAEAISRTATAWATRDPQAAAEYINSNLHLSPDQTSALQRAVALAVAASRSDE